MHERSVPALVHRDELVAGRCGVNQSIAKNGEKEIRLKERYPYPEEIPVLSYLHRVHNFFLQLLAAPIPLGG